MFIALKRRAFGGNHPCFGGEDVKRQSRGEGEFRNGEPFNGICETPDFDRHPYYVKIGEYIEGEMVRELPFEFRLGLVESDEEKLH